MKPGRNRLQLSVFKRLEAGLPPTRWQQLRLHMHPAWRRGRRLNVQRLWFHVKGVLRVFWMPWTLFRFRSVPVQIHSTFLIYPVGFFTWDRYVEDAGAGVLRGIVFLLVYSCSLLVHEFAHVFTARRWGIASRCVILIPFGAVAELVGRASRPLYWPPSRQRPEHDSEFPAKAPLIDTIERRSQAEITCDSRSDKFADRHQTRHQRLREYRPPMAWVCRPGYAP